MQIHYYYLYTVNKIGLLKMIQNAIKIHRKEQVTPRIIEENIRGNFIHIENIVAVSHIYRVDMYPPILHIINMAVNHLITVVKFLVVYHQDAQNMFQSLQNVHHKNIIFRPNLFLMVILEVNTVKVKKSCNASQNI